MSKQAIFRGLVVDEFDRPVDLAYVGEEPCYVVDDAGFRRHVPSEQVDRQVLNWMLEMVEGHEDTLAEQTSKMLGQDDIFSRAMIENQIHHMDEQFEKLLQTGIPEEGLAYMGMMGFRVVINLHGEVVRVEQPGAMGGEGGEE